MQYTLIELSRRIFYSYISLQRIVVLLQSKVHRSLSESAELDITRDLHDAELCVLQYGPELMLSESTLH